MIALLCFVLTLFASPFNKEPPSFASSRHRSIPLHPISKVDLSQSSKVSAPLKELFFFGNFCKTPGEA